MARWIIMTGLVAAGCSMGSMSSGNQLRESIVAVNDALRWSRMDIAMQRVDPDYAELFVQRRQRWGQRVQLADQELLNIRMADDGEHATSTVAWSWYAYDTMTMQQTVIEQRWRKAHGTFVLIGENVLQGDPDLLRTRATEDAS